MQTDDLTGERVSEILGSWYIVYLVGWLERYDNFYLKGAIDD